MENTVKLHPSGHTTSLVTNPTGKGKDPAVLEPKHGIPGTEPVKSPPTKSLKSIPVARASHDTAGAPPDIKILNAPPADGNRRPLPPMRLSRLAMDFATNDNPQLAHLHPGSKNWDGRPNVTEMLDFGQDLPENTLEPAIKEVKEREQRRHVFMNQFSGAEGTGGAGGAEGAEGAAAAAGAAGAKPEEHDLKLKGIDYVDIDKKAGSALEKQLTAAGVNVPGAATSRFFLTYSEDEHLNNLVSDQGRARQIRWKNSGLEDSGPINRLRHRIDESKVIHVKTLHQFAYQRALGDVSILSKLYEPAPNGKDVRLKIRTIEGLNAFFTGHPKDFKHFNITVPEKLTIQSQTQLALVQAQAQQHTGPIGPLTAAQAAAQAAAHQQAEENVLDAHLNRLLAKLPLAFHLAPGDGSGGLKGLAMMHAQESVDQARFCAKHIQRFTLEDGTSCQRDLDNPANFKLLRETPFKARYPDVQSYERGEATFTRQHDGTYDVRMFGINAAGERHEIPLVDDHGVDHAWPRLKECFNINSALTPLFGDGTRLRHDGFDALFGKRMAQRTLERKALDFISQPYKHEFDKVMKKVISLIGSGYSFNPDGGDIRGGHWGTNFANDSRARFMRHVFDRAVKEHKQSAGGSCGTQQDAIMYAGGHIATVVDLTGRTYLASPHGNDKLAVHEKNTFSDIDPFTATGGNYERPVGTRKVPGLRPASDDAPIPQTKAFSLVGEIDIDNGYWTPVEEQKVYQTREMAPLSVSIAVHATASDDLDGIRNDSETNEVTFESIMIEYDGKPVMSNSRFVETTNLRQATPMPATSGKGKQAENFYTTQDIEIEVARQLAEVRAGTRTELTFGDLVFRHDLPRDTALADDKGNFLRDKQGKLVKTRETVIVRPRIERRTVTEPQTETYVDEISGETKSRFVYVDDPLDPGKQMVPKRTREIVDVKFDIVEIDRWRRIGIRNPQAKEPGAGEFLRDKDNNVLCKFERVKQVFTTNDQLANTQDARPFGPADQAMLVDMVYGHNNCVHSHNGLNVQFEHDLLPGNVRIVGRAIDPNDRPLGKSHVPAISPGNPFPHAVPTDPNKPASSYISEQMEMYAANMAIVVTGQPHTDAETHDAGENMGPYGAKPYKAFDPKYYGNRWGNTNIVQTGVNAANVNRGLLPELAARRDQSRSAVDFTWQQNLNASEHFGRQEKLFFNFSVERTKENLVALRDGLLPPGRSHHPLWKQAMSRLEEAFRANPMDENDYPADIFTETQQIFVDIHNAHIDGSIIEIRQNEKQHRNLVPSEFSPNAKARNDALHDKYGQGTADDATRFVDGTKARNTPSKVNHRNDVEFEPEDEVPVQPAALTFNWDELNIEELGKAVLDLVDKIDKGTPEEREAAFMALADSPLTAQWPVFKAKDNATAEEIAAAEQIATAEKIGTLKDLVNSQTMVELNNTLDKIDGLGQAIGMMIETAGDIRGKVEPPPKETKDGPNQTLGGDTLRRFFRAENNGAWSVPPGLAATIGDDTVAASIGDLVHGIHNISQGVLNAVLGAMATTSGVASLLLLTLAVASAKDGKAAAAMINTNLQQLGEIADDLQKLRDEVDEIGKELKVVNLKARTVKEGFTPGTANNMKLVADKLYARLDQALQKHENAVADRVSILKKQRGETIFGSATTTAAFGADGLLVGAEAALSLVPGMHALATLLGTIGSGVLAAYGLMQLGLVIKQSREIASITQEQLEKEFGPDSGLGLRVLEAIANKQSELMTKKVTWSLFTLGNGMIIASPFSGPAAPALFAVGAAVVVTTTGAIIVPPLRQTRNRTARQGLDTAHIRGSFLNDNARRNRLVHHDNSILAIQYGEVQKMVEAMSSPRYTTSRWKQLRFQFEQARGLRWVYPNADRKILAKEINAHFEETKEHQFNLMLRTTQHEENHWKYRRAELARDVINLNLEIAAIENATGTDKLVTGDGKATELRKKLDNLLQELHIATEHFDALKDLRLKLEEFSPALQSDWRWREDEFRKLQVRYILAHDHLVDAMSRDQMKQMLAADDKPASMVATPRERTRMLGPLRVKESIADLQYKYDDDTIEFVETFMNQNLGGVGKRFVKVMLYALEDLSKYELQAVENQTLEAKQREKRGEKLAKTAKPVVTAGGGDDSGDTGAGTAPVTILVSNSESSIDTPKFFEAPSPPMTPYVTAPQTPEKGSNASDDGAGVGGPKLKFDDNAIVHKADGTIGLQPTKTNDSVPKAYAKKELQRIAEEREIRAYADLGITFTSTEETEDSDDDLDQIEEESVADIDQPRDWSRIGKAIRQRREYEASRGSQSRRDDQQDRNDGDGII